MMIGTNRYRVIAQVSIDRASIIDPNTTSFIVDSEDNSRIKIKNNRAISKAFSMVGSFEFE